MKDFDGEDLVEGWYWYSSNDESDVFHPVYIRDSKVAVVNGQSVLTSRMEGLNLFRAEMPEPI